jgi:hypothetical protein
MQEYQRKWNNHAAVAFLKVCRYHIFATLLGGGTLQKMGTTIPLVSEKVTKLVEEEEDKVFWKVFVRDRDGVNCTGY